MLETGLSLAGLLLGLGLGYLFWFRPLSQENLGLFKEIERYRLEAQWAADNLKQAEIAIARLETQLQAEEKAANEKILALQAVQAQIEKDLKILTKEALKENKKSFLEEADRVFKAEFDKREAGFAQKIEPFDLMLQKYQKELQEIEKTRSQAYGELSAELKNVASAQSEVRTVTAKLVNSLRAAPKTRGRWGEEQLKNVMELSGMSAYVDYETEESFSRDGARLRPDAVIRMPGERHLVVDAKVPLSAYLDAIEATDEASRDLLLKKHVEEMRAHVKKLSDKSYWDGFSFGGHSITPDFVAMFVPGDNFFAAAMERAPGLFSEAVEKKVLIVTPTTLVALAKAIAFGWRQEKVAENAQKIQELGRELYKRLLTMGDSITKLGNNLRSAGDAYNGMVGTLETRVLVQARRFTEDYGLETDKLLPDIERVETEVREVKKLALPVSGDAVDNDGG